MKCMSKFFLDVFFKIEAFKVHTTEVSSGGTRS